MELDHLVIFVEPDAHEAGALGAVGLRESFRRHHPGQGTANVCYCFDNAYLELLGITDSAETLAPVVARLRLAERAAWRRTGASPFGVALRLRDSRFGLPFEVWNYAAPYLPAGTVIPVAVTSDDPRQPLVFCSPGGQRPDTWTGGRASERQRPAGLTEIAGVRLSFRTNFRPSAALQSLALAAVISFGATEGEPRMVLTLARADGGPSRSLNFPTLTWL